MKSPGRMVCHGCYEDIGPTRFADDVHAWVYECPRCVSVDGPLTIEIADGPGSGKKSLRDGSGIMAELGIYDGLKEAVSLEPDRWLEFGVVEHLYASVEHEAFRRLVDDYGHVAIHPDTNTASWMLGRALWALKREGELAVKGHPGTGRWDYLKAGNAWALMPPPSEPAVLSWAAFAEREGIHPWTCPSIDWRETPNASPKS